MNTQAFKKANDHFRSGEYKEALNHYERVAHIYGADLVSANIEICKKKILEDRKRFDQAVPAESSKGTNLAVPLFNRLGIEKIYIVNLSRRPDRLVRIIREMNKHGLACERIDGIDANYSAEAKSNLVTLKERATQEKRKSSSHIPSSVRESYKTILTAGVFGYLLSQKKVFEDAKAKGYKKILVLDDDIFWHSQAFERLNEISEVICRDYKVLLLGSSEYADRDSPEFTSSFLKESKHLYHPIAGKTCGSFSVVYDQSVYDEILEAISEADGPFDNVTLGSIYSKYKNDCFSVTPAICIPDVDDSDIRKSERSQISHSERMHWETLRFREFKSSFTINIVVTSFRCLNLISKISKEPYPGIIVRIFYPSPDGLRPVIPGREFFPLDEQCQITNINNTEQFDLLNEQFAFPRADLLISWPDHQEITAENIAVTACNILQHINKNHKTNGQLGLNFYRTASSQRMIPGRHSVIIPCFRGVDEAIPSITSALLQDAKNFEVIVVNDNPCAKNFEAALRSKLLDLDSPHAGQKLTKLLAERLIVIDHKKNRNAAAARNTGLLHSRGEWITFLDDDDYFESQRLSAVEKTLIESGDEVGACYCGYTGNWNGATKNLDRFPEGNLREKVITLRYAEHYMCTNTITFKRNALEDIGGFDEGYNRHQDLELMARFFENYEIKSVKLFLVKNRPSPVSPTFDANLVSLARLKAKFLKDLAPTLEKSNAALIQSILNAHVSDIFKQQKDPSEEARMIAHAMLEEMLKC